MVTSINNLGNGPYTNCGSHGVLYALSRDRGMDEGEKGRYFTKNYVYFLPFCICMLLLFQWPISSMFLLYFTYEIVAFFRGNHEVYGYCCSMKKVSQNALGFELAISST